MKYYFDASRTRYHAVSALVGMGGETLIETKPIPPEWRLFGKPVRYRGTDGFMGRTREYAFEGWDRRFRLALFWPIRVLAGLQLS